MINKGTKLTKPERYAVSDLPLLRSYSFNKPALDFDLDLISKDLGLFNDVFSNSRDTTFSCGLNDKEIFIYDLSVLENLMAIKSRGVNKIYLGIPEEFIDDDVKLLIKDIVSKHSIQVSIVNLLFVPVVTQAHLLYYCEQAKSIPRNSWLVLVAANNHDLFSKHSEIVKSINNMCMLVPSNAPKLDRFLTNGIANQLAIELSRYNDYCASSKQYNQYLVNLDSLVGDNDLHDFICSMGVVA